MRRLATHAIAAVLGAILAVLALGLGEDAGEDPPSRAGAGGASAPGRAAGSASPDSKEAAALARLLGEPPEDVTREQLLTREAALRRELARLRGATPASEPEDSSRRRPMLDLEPDELRRMAEHCEIRFDVPHLGTAGEQIGSQLPDDAGLTEDEVARADVALGELRKEVASELRRAYAEATGDAEGASQLSPESIMREIFDKTSDAEQAELRRRLSRERAGLESPPTDLRDATPAERYFRLMATLGERFEAALAEVIGAERAGELRRRRGGWSSQYAMDGCPEGG